MRGSESTRENEAHDSSFRCSGIFPNSKWTLWLWPTGSGVQMFIFSERLIAFAL
jgi:hypothetical protein